MLSNLSKVLIILFLSLRIGKDKDYLFLSIKDKNEPSDERFPL